MQEKDLVEIVKGSKKNLLAVVTNTNGTGENKDFVEVFIHETKSHYWLSPANLKIVSFKTKKGDRIQITYVPAGITNVKQGQEGVIIEEPEIFNNSIRVKVKLDDQQTIIWLESNLEVIQNSDRVKVTSSSELILPESEEKEPINLIERNGKLFAKVKDLRKHPLNDKIYDSHNIEPLLGEIKASGWIETLLITPDGKTISGNSRLECCRRLAIAKGGARSAIEEVEVRVGKFKDEIEEIDAFLLANSYRIKTNEELIREGLLREEVEAKKIARKESLRKKNQSTKVISSESSHSSGKNLQARDIVAKDLGMGPQKYSRGKKVVQAIDRLKFQSNSGAVKSLRNTLNKKSVNTAYNQLKDLNKIEKAIATYNSDGQTERAAELDNILQNHTIEDGIFQMETWKRDDRRFEYNFQHLDVVRIKDKEHFNEWAILDTYDEEKLSAVVQTVRGDFDVLLANVERIELNEEEKEAARQLMQRLQTASYNLQTNGEPYGHETIQYIAKKKIPTLSKLEETYLKAIENLNADIEPEEQLGNEEINVNIALNNFVRSLEYAGVEDIRVAARAISRCKNEAVIEAATYIISNSEQVKAIVQAYIQKYPDAVKDALG